MSQTRLCDGRIAHEFGVVVMSNTPSVYVYVTEMTAYSVASLRYSFGGLHQVQDPIEFVVYGSFIYNIPKSTYLETQVCARFDEEVRTTSRNGEEVHWERSVRGDVVGYVATVEAQGQSWGHP